MVVLNHNAHYIVTGYDAVWLDHLNCTGNRRINRCRYKTLGFRNLLSCQYMVSLCHDRHCRRTDMLGQRIYQVTLWQNCLHGLILRQILPIIGMNAAHKCQLSHSPIILPFLFCF